MIVIVNNWGWAQNNRIEVFLSLELQHIIRTQHLFLFDAEVDSDDAGVGVVEDSQMIS